MTEHWREWVAALQGDTGDRAAAAAALVELGTPAVGLLWPLLKDPRPSVRAAAAEILGGIGPAAEPALPALAPLLYDREAEVRQQAATALRNIDLRYMRRQRRRRLGRRLFIAACFVALFAAGYALDAHGRALGLLRGEDFFEGRPTRYWREQLSASADQGGEVALARLRAGGRQAIPVLLAIASDRDAARDWRPDEVFELLGRTKSAEAVPTLVALLEDENPRVRARAAGALGSLGELARPSVSALYSALKRPIEAGPEYHAQKDARESYARALEQIGGDPQVENIFVNFRSRENREQWFSLQFSADGSRLLAHREWNGERELLGWNRTIRAGGDYRTLRIVDGVRRAAIHPGGEEAVVADVVGNVTRYELFNHEKLGTLGRLPVEDVPLDAVKNCPQMAYSPDGRYFALIRGVRGGTLELYAATGSQWERLTHLENLPTQPVHGVLFSADSRTIVVVAEPEQGEASDGSKGTTWVFDLESGRLRQRLPASPLGVGAAISADGQLLAVNLNFITREVEVWEVEDRKRVSVLGDAEGAGIRSFVFVGRHYMAIGMADGEIALWDATAGTKVRDLSWHAEPVTALAVSPDGKTLASADELSWVRLWDLGEFAERE